MRRPLHTCSNLEGVYSERRGRVTACGFYRIRNVRIPGTFHSPVYSGKAMVRGLRLIFSSKRSFLFRKRMIEVSVNLEFDNFLTRYFISQISPLIIADGVEELHRLDHPVLKTKYFLSIMKSLFSIHLPKLSHLPLPFPSTY